MKKLSVIILLLSIAQFSLAQGETDSDLLKTQIRELEKVVKTEEKEVEKLEKSLVSVRPAAEQARRDADNIKEMYVQKKSAFEAFHYDQKTATLKSNQKALKNLDKDVKTLAKNQTKLEASLSNATTEHEMLTQQNGSRNAELEMVKTQNNSVSKEEEQAHAALLKSKEAQGTEQHNNAVLYKQNIEKEKALEKDVRSVQKNASKKQNEIAKTKLSADENAKRKMAVEKEFTDLKISVDSLSAKLALMNPKKVNRELADLDKQAKEVQLNHAKLQAELDQTTRTINEKHDLMEKRKQEIREKESILKMQ